MNKIKTIVAVVLIAFCAGCGSKIKEKKDEVYSRHLQKKVPITIITTPVPDNKSDFNLLILNDGQDLDQLRVKEITDSLYRKKLIQPLLIIGVTTLDRKQWYGVAGFSDYKKNGAAAEKYSNFIINELLPFVKKKSGVRKFKSITIAGNSLGALSALDIAWNNGDKFDKSGLFSGDFGFSDLDVSDSSYSKDKNRIITNKIRSSRKRPKVNYWFYAGSETGNIVENTNDIIDLIRKKNVIAPGDLQFVENTDGSNDYQAWSAVFPQFLIWAVGK
ncbi:MAG: alpha/beta hydrolase-fold protein [Ginsengibacter sp.]